MKTIRNAKGFTLLEIILSIAILGIVAIALLPLFATGFKGIVRAGNRSQSIYISQDHAENKIIQGPSNTATTITITFPSAAPIQIIKSGELVTEDSLTFFIAD